jgi:hypothetical protein
MIFNYEYDPTQWKRLEKKTEEKRKERKRSKSKTGGIMTYEEMMTQTGAGDRLFDGASERIAYSLYYLTHKATNTVYDYELYGANQAKEGE